MDCNHFRQGNCGNCPQLARWPLETAIDRTHFMQKYKLRLINECVHSVVCPSKWIANEAISAGVREEKIRHIPNAVETEIFRPREKAHARHFLGLPQDARIVLLTSMDFDNPYKGMPLAMDALSRQAGPVHLLLIGANSHRPQMPSNVIPTFVERLSDRELQAQYYSCADTLLFPSLEDNCPLTLLEAMACGVPPVAFESGGIKELMDHSTEGWLARRGDIDGLAQGLRTALGNPVLLGQWSDNARSRILRFHTEKIFLDRHLELYNECAKVGVLP
jgi:glycosyltransferase involved in cell wall biosynthesis